MTRRHPNIVRLLLLLVALPAAADTGPAPSQIDVFVTSTIEMIGVERLREQQPDIAITVHSIDGIEQVKAALSRDLPANAETAKRLALRRLKNFAKGEYERLRQSAESLLLARQLGVNRYPAVVFDRQYVIYSVTDLSLAHALFQEQKVEQNR
jgi:integrating conjugative element protein (TIGR03757 family)